MTPQAVRPLLLSGLAIGQQGPTRHRSSQAPADDATGLPGGRRAGNRNTTGGACLLVLDEPCQSHRIESLFPTAHGPEHAEFGHDSAFPRKRFVKACTRRSFRGNVKDVSAGATAIGRTLVCGARGVSAATACEKLHKALPRKRRVGFLHVKPLVDGGSTKIRFVRRQPFDESGEPPMS